MALDHYIPATFLASFSADNRRNRRKRRLYIGDLINQRVFPNIAENVGAEHNLYNIPFLEGTNMSPQILNQTWDKYEAELAMAINQLIKQTIDAVTWARVLVPFAAAILIRSADFSQRFTYRLEHFLDMTPSDDEVNFARLIELQRLLAPILAAKWVVLRVRGEDSVIINDVGWIPFLNKLVGESGISIPLNLRHILVLIPKRKRPLLIEKKGKWYPIIEHNHLYPGNHLELNSILASSAKRFIFGPDERTVKNYMKVDRSSKKMPDISELGFITSHLARAHELTWHRLASALEKSPLEISAWNFEDIDWKLVAAKWNPPIFLGANVPNYPSALSRKNNTVFIDLYDVPPLT